MNQDLFEWGEEWVGRGGRASRLVDGEKKCCISENVCSFFMKFCTYTVLTI